MSDWMEWMEWSGWSGVDGVDTPWTVMTTTLPACDAKKRPIFLFKHYHNPSFLAWKYK